VIHAAFACRLFPTSPATSVEDRRPAAILPLVAVLEQLADLLADMTDEQYRRKPIGPVSSNVGGHVRHCLDHVEALLAGIERGAIDYDQRQRGTSVESNREAALATIREQQRRLRTFPAGIENSLLRLSALVHPSLPQVEATTSVGRELVFVLSHTIHHNALIAVMAKTLGVPLPERFGYAPSTLAHLEKTACAR
jgi:uncharacterized damage-inducible protein DinB